MAAGQRLVCTKCAWRIYRRGSQGVCNQCGSRMTATSVQVDRRAEAAKRELKEQA